MAYDLAIDICSELKYRLMWETRQETWYKMRHTGLRRLALPYPGAADLHFPLIDSLMERMKPFYYKQLFATDQFAAFVSLKTQPADSTSAVASWFDYRLKQKSNFQRKILTTIDAMLLSGRAVMKIYWDFSEKELACAGVGPMYFIVPNDTEELCDAPWCVHVMLYDVATYKTVKYFRQGEDFITKIKGMTTNESGIYGLGSQYDTIKRREGITFSSNDTHIIIWEIYRRDGDKICFDTYSPASFNEEDAVRPRQYLPYDHKTFPFVALRSEIKDEGWYSPRGIPEIVAAFEDSLCRQWNFKHDYMDFVNKPLFINDSGVTNTGNVTFLPGSSIPQGWKPAVMPSPPMSFDQEMQMTRALAEYRVTIPDLGATEHLAAKPTGRGNVTATQIEAIIGQSGLSDDMRSRVFRLDLADIFKMCWSLYRQYDSTSLIYVLYDTVGNVPPDALQGEYEIMPNGAADSWNKPQQLQKAAARLQLLSGSPYWKRNELEKNFVEIDDPRLIKRAYQDPGFEAANQMEQQAQEISIMLLGFPAQVQPADDDKAHLQSLQGFIDKELQEGKPIDPQFAGLALQHVQAHMQSLDQKKDPNLNMVRQQIAPLIQFLEATALGGQQGQQQPGNVVPMQPQQPPEPPTAKDLSSIQSDRVKDAATVANALANLMKSGAQINVADVNTALVNMGLPPITPLAHPLTPAVPPEPPPVPPAQQQTPT